MTGYHHLLECSTPFGLLTLAAMADSGLLGNGPEDRTLLVVSTTPAPESRRPFHEDPVFARALSRFGRVVDWNSLVAPWHPRHWCPAPADAVVLERLLRRLLQVDEDDLSLVVESLHMPPSRTMATIFSTASVTVYADGLMIYGPTRNDLPESITGRLARLVMLDLLDGVRPRLLHEHRLPLVDLPFDAFRAVVQELVDHSPDLPAPASGTAVVLGQYLGQLGLVTTAEEEEQHGAMLRTAAAAGASRVVFKPHPAAVGDPRRGLGVTAAALGIEVEIFDSPVLAEVLVQHLRPVAVVSAFSTGLFTARALQGCRVLSHDTGAFLRRLAPLANSNRVPAAICDATVESWDETTGALRAPLLPLERPADVQRLVDAIAYCIQPDLLPELRGAAEQMAAEQPDILRRSVPAPRLFHLGLPGGHPGTLWVRRLPAPVLDAVRPRVPGIARRRAQVGRLAAPLVRRLRSTRAVRP